MDIGLNVAEGVRVRVGDTVENVTKQLKEHKISYEIPYKNVQENNVSMVMFIEKCGVELNITNDKITFIKSSNSESNYVMQLGEETKALEALRIIKSTLADKFNVKAETIRIDKFDSKSFNSTLSIPVQDTIKAQIELILGGQQKIYMHSIGLVT